MPGWDGRGPWGGTGPGTGWGLGPCGAGAMRGRGFRRAGRFGGGFGYGRGFGPGWGAPWGAAPYGGYPAPWQNVDPADEKAALEDELGALEAQMKEVRDRLDRIEKES
ncbi:MAG TPA: DUF5320 domain-containing protein [Thermovirgaceae bacterium]|nr:DUF5320 domain-containing protein [Thermovirgaceae bacterium]